MNVCPACASANIQRAEVSWIMADRRSALAIAIAPPNPKRTPGLTALAVFGTPIGALGFLVAIAGVGGVGWAITGLTGLAALSVAIAGKVAAAAHNRETLPRLTAEWREKWICLKCGEIFRPKRLDAAPAIDQPVPTPARQSRSS